MNLKGISGDFPNFFAFFLHNFWTRNARKPIKPLKNSYYNLVSNKILSEKIGAWRWHLGPANLIQICTNLLSLWCHQQNNKYLKLPNFSFQIETTRLSASVECLNNSPAQLAGKFGLQPIWPRLPFVGLDFSSKFGF